MTIRETYSTRFPGKVKDWEPIWNETCSVCTIPFGEHFIPKERTNLPDSAEHALEQLRMSSKMLRSGASEVGAKLADAVDKTVEGLVGLVESAPPSREPLRWDPSPDRTEERL